MRILVAPPTQTSQTIREHLISWSASGLLRPFCWATVALDAPATAVRVERIDAGETETGLLADALRGASNAEIALAGIYAATPEEGFAAEFAERLLEQVEAATKIVAPDPHQDRRAWLVVAPREVGQAVARELFSFEWAGNVYVVPEDREAPGAPNELEGNPERFPAHAAHAFATVTDLWRRSGDDARPLLTRLGTDYGQDVPVSLVRCYSRVVDFGYLPSHLAAAVFKPGNAWPNPDQLRFNRVSVPGDRLAGVVSSYLYKHRHVLGLSEPELLKEPEPPRLTIWQAIKRLVRELILQLKSKPLELIEATIVKAHNDLAERLEQLAGPDSGWKVRRIGPGSVETELIESGRELTHRAVRLPDGPVADTWTDLRMLVLGLVDGTDLPDGIDDSLLVDADGRRDVFPDPRKVVPDASRRPPSRAEHPDPRACDPLRLDPRFGPRPPLEGEPAAPESEFRELWSAAHVDTPIWQIGVAIASNLRQARDESGAGDQDEWEQFVARERELVALEKTEVKRRRRRVFRRFVSATALAGISAAAAIVLLGVLPGLVIAAAIALIWSAAIVRLAVRALSRRDRRRIEVLSRSIAATNAAIERAYRRGDALRLQRRYAEYLDWSEIGGWMAHHPWVGDPLERVEIAAPVDPSKLPAALGVAAAETREHLGQLTSDARRSLFTPNWLTGLYTTLENASQAVVRRQLLLGPGAPLDAPAADVAEDEDSPRRVLLRRMRGGEGRRLSDNPLSHRLLEILDGVAVDGASEYVIPVDERDDAGTGFDALPPATSWFDEPADLADIVGRLRPTVVRIGVESARGSTGATGVVVGGDGLIATAGHVVRGAHRIRVTFDDGATADAELVREANWTDLALIRASAHPAAVAAIDANRSPRQGDPVITLGHSRLQAGEPSFAWGLITAIERTIMVAGVLDGTAGFRVLQATYTSAGGASGSPVWDLSERLVGIHSAGSGPIRESDDSVPEYLSSAVPVHDVLALMRDEGVQAATVKPSTAAHRPRGADQPTPSAFLDGIDATPDDLAMLHQHWADLGGNPDRVREVLRSRHEAREDATLATAAGRTSFLHPVRALTHRIDVAGPVEPNALRSCREST